VKVALVTLILALSSYACTGEIEDPHGDHDHDASTHDEDAGVDDNRPSPDVYVTGLSQALTSQTYTFVNSRGGAIVPTPYATKHVLAVLRTLMMHSHAGNRNFWSCTETGGGSAATCTADPNVSSGLTYARLENRRPSGSNQQMDVWFGDGLGGRHRWKAGTLIYLHGQPAAAALTSGLTDANGNGAQAYQIRVNVPNVTRL
jgi:hypothetical protein